MLGVCVDLCTYVRTCVACMVGFPSGPESLISSIMHEYSLISDATRCRSEVVRKRRHSCEMKSAWKTQIYTYVRTYVHVQLGQTEQTASYSHSSGRLEIRSMYIRTVRM